MQAIGKVIHQQSTAYVNGHLSTPKQRPRLVCHKRTGKRYVYSRAVR